METSMNSLEELDLAYARAMRARGRPAVRDARPPTEIVESWARCIDAGLDAAAAPRIRVVGDAQLQRRREQSHYVRRLALAELETLFHQIAGSNFLLAFADHDGVILDLYADNRFATSSSGEDILVGSHWTEQVAGTNGLGTALASGKPVAVNGPEHYFTKYGDLSCTASPIRDASGAIVGVLDASSYFESRQRHTQALVQMAASHIENLLFARERDADTLLAIHPRAEFLATISAGLLAFDEGGRLSAFNTRAVALLAGLELRVGTPFEELFGELFVRVQARLEQHAEMPLRDALGSTLMVSWLNRRPRVLVRSANLRARAPADAPAPVEQTAAPLADDDPAARRAIELVTAAMHLRTPVLLRGETGSGKELLARLAHSVSGRKGPFVAVDCGALPPERCEAALFGYVAGAFEGARREGRGGLIASADGGTLLLDEVSHLARPVQAALLRFLDDMTLRPVGGWATRRVDIQLLAATNADLDAEVAARRFGADLLFRLNTICVDLPPLRRRSDFARCVRATLCRLDGRASISQAAIDRLALHEWPGNFRELHAVLARALLLHPTGQLDVDDLHALLPAAGEEVPAARSALRRGAAEAVQAEFARCGGSVSETARTLGISRTTVYRHLRSMAPRPD
jgi:sigma-54 dependent transcriptional regulator, acetoin dehydrogenase operon transcriptional activator AcoR